jgi:hypothetical protein
MHIGLNLTSQQLGLPMQTIRLFLLVNREEPGKHGIEFASSMLEVVRVPTGFIKP